MNTDKKRIEWADAFKGVLILLVVIGHCIQSVYVQRGADFKSDYWWNLIYSFHMPAFIAMSGFIAFRPESAKISRTSDLGALIFRRMRQLVVPFIIWSVIMFFVNSNVDHLHEYILYPNKSYWFLWALFFITAIFNVADFISIKFHLNQESAMTCMALILMVINFILPDSKILGFEYISYYFLFYTLAYYLHKYNNLVPKNIWLLTILAALWFVLGSFYLAKGVPSIVSWIPHIPGSILNIIYRLITATIFISMMLGVGYKISTYRNKLWRIILEFGNVSLGIYVVHMVLRGWIVKGLDYIMPWCPNWALITISFILIAVISLWIVRLLKTSKISNTWLLGKV